MTTLATDNFNRADGALGANWTTPSGLSAMGIVSNQADCGASGLTVGALYTGFGAVSNDQWAQSTLTALGSGPDFMGLCLRGQTGADTEYIFFVGAIGAGSSITVARRNAGAFTGLSSTTATTALGDVWYFEIQTLTLRVKQNGGAFIAALTFTDSGGSTIASGYPGMFGGSTTHNAQKLDDFSMGNFASAAGLLPQLSNQGGF